VSWAARGAARARFLPPGLSAVMVRRLGQLFGIALVVAAAALAIALLSFEPADPSFNRATSAAIDNWMGRPGAYAADLLLRTIGLGGGLIVLIVAGWGWRLWAGRPLTPLWLRLSLVPFALMSAAIALAAATTPASWPLSTGLGGFAGTIMLDWLRGLATDLGFEVDIDVVGLVAAGLAVTVLVPAMAFSLREWQGGAATLAMLAGRTGAAVTIAAARLATLMRRLRERPPPRRETARRRRSRPAERVEPRLEPLPGGLIDGRPRQVAPGKRAEAARQGRLALDEAQTYTVPELELLASPPRRVGSATVDELALAQNARYLETVLDDFGIRGTVVKVRPGPVVTLYELEPAPGTKSSRIINLADDIARSMSAISVRVAVVPGRNVIGIELPNARREPVFLRELLASDAYDRSAAKLPLVLGKDIGGGPVIVDLARMPHLLIAGTTGSGKSVAINTMILSLLYRLPPDQCKFIMIDPKMLELSVYDDIPQLLTPVVTNPRKAVVAFKWAVREMESRYQAMSLLGVRNIEGYNARIAEARRKGAALRRRARREDPEGLGGDELEPLPYIVVVVDEMADLMLVAGKDVEAAVQRLAQMARAAGIHLIMATQRPSVDVITGTIKANFPTRISFQVSSKIDSRTILGEQGAEQLLGQGDMLYMAGGGRITRVHGPFVGDEEVEDVVRYLKTQGEPIYNEEVTEEEEEAGLLPGIEGGDELYDQAVALVVREGKASTSFVQRHLQIGYNRAARIVERMEAEGVVSPANRVGKREVLAHGFADRAD